MTAHDPNEVAGTSSKWRRSPTTEASFALSLDEMFLAREERKQRSAEALMNAARREQAHRDGDLGRFEARKLTDADRRAVLTKITAAFESGQREMMLVSFPSDYCSDGGRRINNRLPGWLETLPAGAQVFLEFWRDALQPGGFGLGARVLDFPRGMLGDVGLFVTWPQSRG